MTKDEVELILAKLGVNSSQILHYPNKNQMSICCPLAKWLHSKGTDSNPSLSIKYSNQNSTVFKCFACNEHGKLWQLVDSLGRLSGDQALIELAEKLIDSDKPTLDTLLSSATKDLTTFVKTPVNVQPIALNKEILKRFVPALSVPSVADYLSSRGLTTHAIHKFNLLYDFHKDRVVFPVYGTNDELLGAVGRIMPRTEHPAKYYNYFGFEASYCLGGANYLDKSLKRIILVEGYMCLVKGYEWAKKLDSNLVCTFHAELSEVQTNMLLRLDLPIWVWYDNDKAGITGWEKIRSSLMGKVPRLKRLVLPEKVDVASMNEVEFSSYFEKCLKEF